MILPDDNFIFLAVKHCFHLRSKILLLRNIFYCSSSYKVILAGLFPKHNHYMNLMLTLRKLFQILVINIHQYADFLMFSFFFMKQFRIHIYYKKKRKCYFKIFICNVFFFFLFIIFIVLVKIRSIYKILKNWKHLVQNLSKFERNEKLRAFGPKFVLLKSIKYYLFLYL